MDALALFPELEPAGRAYYEAQLAQLADNDTTDRARFIRAKASGIRWECPDQCTDARGDVCACPCGRRCHGRGYCGGH